MTAPALSVDRMHTRYRIAPHAPQETRERLDAIVRDALDGALETALGRLDLTPGEEICIDAVRSRVRLPLDSTDAAASAAWSATTVDAIARAIAVGGPGVVRYASRRQALADVAASIARGDLSRAWAWRQLGLWRAPDGPGSADVAVELVHALRCEPAAVAPLAAGLARAGLFRALVDQIGSDAIVAVAGTALQAADVPLGAVLAGELPASARPPAVAAAAVAATAERIARRSAIVAAGPGARDDPVVRRALAVLAVLECEPTALGTSEALACTLVADVAERIAQGDGARSGETGADERAGAGAASEPEPGARCGAEGGEPTPEATASPEGDGLAGTDDAGPTRDVGYEPPAAARTGEEDTTRNAAPELTPEPGQPANDSDPPEAPDAPPEIARCAADTALGGLLFLLHVIGELEVPSELESAPELNARSLRWSLHRLGMALAGAQRDDPAALAFAGLAPDTDPPGADERGPDPDELDAIAAAAARIVRRLRELLARPDDPGAELLALVCARHAQIVSDPGWIEAHLRIEDVSIDLRRAGLDLDPGWVPWLGTVVRIVYG